MNLCVLCSTPIWPGEKTVYGGDINGDVHEDCYQNCCDMQGDMTADDIVETRLKRRNNNPPL